MDFPGINLGLCKGVAGTLFTNKAIWHCHKTHPKLSFFVPHLQALRKSHSPQPGVWGAPLPSKLLSWEGNFIPEDAAQALSLCSSDRALNPFQQVRVGSGREIGSTEEPQPLPSGMEITEEGEGATGTQQLLLELSLPVFCQPHQNCASG